MKTRTIMGWDLGATKCGAAIVEYNAITQHFACKKYVSVKLKNFDSLEGLALHIEEKLDLRARDADAVCIGAAGVFNGKSLELVEGYPYPMEIAALARKYQWPVYTVIHDYAPIVCSTFVMSPQHPSDKPLNDVRGNPVGRRVALGVGTGLGLKDGVLFPGGDFWLGANEWGHIGVTIPPLATKEDRERHEAYLAFLRSEHHLQFAQPLTFEKILSGRGLARLHQFFYPSENVLDPAEVGELMRIGKANDTLQTFAWYLGLFVGTVQLAMMPDGGIWITGGIVNQHLEIVEQPDFQRGIVASPAYLSLRQQFPLAVLHRPEHVYIGAAYFVVRRLLLSIA